MTEPKRLDSTRLERDGDSTDSALDRDNKSPSETEIIAVFDILEIHFWGAFAAVFAFRSHAMPMPHRGRQGRALPPSPPSPFPCLSQWEVSVWYAASMFSFYNCLFVCLGEPNAKNQNPKKRKMEKGKANSTGRSREATSTDLFYFLPWHFGEPAASFLRCYIESLSVLGPN